MGKIFNYRFFCFTALAAACAVIPCIFGFSFLACLIIGAIFAIAAVLCLFLKLSNRTRWTIYFVFILFSTLTVVNHFRLLAVPNESISDARLRFYVTDVSIDKTEVSGDCINLDSGVRYNSAVFITNISQDGYELYAGDVIDVIASVETIPFGADGGKLASYYHDGFRYLLKDVEFYDVSRGEAKLSVAETIRSYMLNRVNELFDGDVRGVAAALLFGDKSMLSNKVKSDMSASGLSHVLAISGLHFSVLAGIVAFALEKTKINVKPKIVISMLFMLTYAWICDFSPSVTRAFIMIFVSCLARWSCRRYDLLSSVCFAVTLGLIIKPENLVSLSFLMSYTAVLGITFLAKPIKRMLSKLPNWLSDFISVSLSANLGIFPIACQAFGKTSVLFLLSNALVLPLMGIAYVLLLSSLIPGIIGGVLGSITSVALNYILGVGEWVASIPLAVMETPGVGAMVIIVYYAIVIYSSEYILRKK